MINRDTLPMSAPNSILSDVIQQRIYTLTELHRNINKPRATEVYQVEDVIQEMITELEDIKESGQ